MSDALLGVRLWVGETWSGHRRRLILAIHPGRRVSRESYGDRTVIWRLFTMAPASTGRPAPQRGPLRAVSTATWLLHAAAQHYAFLPDQSGEIQPMLQLEQPLLVVLQPKSSSQPTVVSDRSSWSARTVSIVRFSFLRSQNVLTSSTAC
jgi:hypothetical protein